MSKDSLDSLKQKLMVNRVFETPVPLENDGVYKTVATEPMSKKASKEFMDKLKPYVDFSDINTNALANNGNALEQGIGPILQKAIVRDFGKPIVDDSTTSPGTNKGYTLDETKLTPERIKAFGHDVSQEVANYSQQLELAERTFKRCEDNGMKFSPEQKEKIMKQLTPTLNSLGSEHVEKNMDDIAKDLSNKLKDNRSIISRITGRESISSAVLEKITAQISEKERPKSINASLQALEEKKREHTMDVPNSHTNSNEDLIKKYRDYNARVQHFAMQNGIMDPAASKEPVDIAKIRLINPKAFDEAVFSQKTQNRSAEEVIHSLKGAQVIDEISRSQAGLEPKKLRPQFLKETTQASLDSIAASEAVEKATVEPKKLRPQFLKETRQASLDSIAASEAVEKATVEPKKLRPDPAIRELSLDAKLEAKQYQGTYVPASKTNSNPDDNHVHHPNSTPKVDKPVTIGRHRDIGRG